jgi:hypothetical protein
MQRFVLALLIVFVRGQDPDCERGELTPDGTACCRPGCPNCGGSGCSQHLGHATLFNGIQLTPSDCCEGLIKESGRFCEFDDAPCAWRDLECDGGEISPDGSVCCALGCDSCGEEEECSVSATIAGQASRCCAENIRGSGRSCDTHISPCFIEIPALEDDLFAELAPAAAEEAEDSGGKGRGEGSAGGSGSTLGEWLNRVVKLPALFSVTDASDPNCENGFLSKDGDLCCHSKCFSCAAAKCGIPIFLESTSRTIGAKQCCRSAIESSDRSCSIIGAPCKISAELIKKVDPTIDALVAPHVLFAYGEIHGHKHRPLVFDVSNFEKGNEGRIKVIPAGLKCDALGGTDDAIRGATCKLMRIDSSRASCTLSPVVGGNIYGAGHVCYAVTQSGEIIGSERYSPLTYPATVAVVGESAREGGVHLALPALGCHPDNCAQWSCEEWCKCFNEEHNRAGLYHCAGETTCDCTCPENCQQLKTAARHLVSGFANLLQTWHTGSEDSPFGCEPRCGSLKLNPTGTGFVGINGRQRLRAI